MKFIISILSCYACARARLDKYRLNSVAPCDGEGKPGGEEGGVQVASQAAGVEI